MEQKALIKAKIRLRVALKAVEDLEACDTYDAFCDTWYIFLHASKSIYTVLQQGAKTTPQCRQWFGAKNTLRLNDPLLRYVTEARNDDEHGIEPMSEFVPGEVTFGVNEPGYSSMLVDEFGNIAINCGAHTVYKGDVKRPPPKLQALDGKPILTRETKPHVKLVRVHDRSRHAFDPPTSHLGQTLKDSSPLNVAKLMLAQLQQLISEAEGFVMP